MVCKKYMVKLKKLDITASNYCETYEPIQIVLKEYINIVKMYIDYFSIYIKKNKIHIITQGLDSITYIFSLLLLHSKNLELTVHHTQQAFLYYIEFINQIDNDNNSFLKLNSKDAILFIYEKTIFKIIKKNTFDKIDLNYCNVINKFSSLFKNIYFYSINDFVNDNIVDENYLKYGNINNVNENIIKIITTVSKKYDESLFDKLFQIIYFLENRKISYLIFIENLKLLLKKKKFYNISVYNFNKNLNNDLEIDSTFINSIIQKP
jgi:hypothetical protein